MTRALLAGTKTQTRRVMRPQPVYDDSYQDRWMVAPKACWLWHPGKDSFLYAWENRGFRFDPRIETFCPYGAPGDRLWVREKFRAFDDDGDLFFAADWPEGCVPVHADDDPRLWRWQPSIHMPRRASRLTLEVLDVRVQRLQDISIEDAHAEGCPADMHGFRSEQRPWFAQEWDRINAKRGYSWEANPWVWTVTFRRVEL